MKKITAIIAQKKNPNRVSVFLDGEYAFGLARITAAWLKKGDEVSDEKIASLIKDDLGEQAYQQALLYLSYRARSEKEIRQNLRKHEYSEDAIERTMEKLLSAGFANDHEFARAWVENRSAFRPRSKKALAIELRQKGLNDDVIDVSLSELDEQVLAYDAGTRRSARLLNLDRAQFQKKLSEYLFRRGFSYSVCISVVSRIWEETHKNLTS